MTVVIDRYCKDTQTYQETTTQFCNLVNNSNDIILKAQEITTTREEDRDKQEYHKHHKEKQRV